MQNLNAPQNNSASWDLTRYAKGSSINHSLRPFTYFTLQIPTSNFMLPVIFPRTFSVQISRPSFPILFLPIFPFTDFKHCHIKLTLVQLCFIQQARQSLKSLSSCICPLSSLLTSSMAAACQRLSIFNELFLSISVPFTSGNLFNSIKCNTISPCGSSYLSVSEELAHCS